MKNLAIIPARSGSKGLKDKNIRLMHGKPLLAYSIEAALDSGCFAEVMVSTDSQQYADIAKTHGASVPFLRDEKNARDQSSSWDMVDEVLAKYHEQGEDFDSFCLLQPTSPLRNAEDIRNAYELFFEKKAKAVVSVCEAEHSPLWCGQLPESLSFEHFLSEANTGRRQDMGRFYRLNGAIYIADTERYRENHYLYDKDGYAYIMPQERSIDIDTKLDFTFAELILDERA